MMNTFTKTFAFAARIAGIAVIILHSTLISAFGQISYAGDRHKPDSRKVRREAARYAKKNNAEEYVGSHLDMDMFSFRRGEPGQPPMTDEMASDQIYNGEGPIQTDRKGSRRKK